MITILEIPEGVIKREKRWIRNCPKCNNEVSHARRNYCIHSHLLKQPCKKCSNFSNHPSGMVGNVRVAWFNGFYKSAISRGLDWQITAEYVNEIYIQQAGRCALSGIPVSWSERFWEHTASIDRIDNAQGYVPGNIQIVHKHINMMRGQLPVPDFVSFCQAVASKANREKW